MALADMSKLLRAIIEGTAFSEPERGADRMILLSDVLLEPLLGRLPHLRAAKNEIAKEVNIADDEEGQDRRLEPACDA